MAVALIPMRDAAHPPGIAPHTPPTAYMATRSPASAFESPKSCSNPGKSGASAEKKIVSTRTTALEKTMRRRTRRCYPAARTASAARSPARSAPSM
jgi:hypothetical protein